MKKAKTIKAALPTRKVIVRYDRKFIDGGSLWEANALRGSIMAAKLLGHSTSVDVVDGSIEFYVMVHEAKP